MDIQKNAKNAFWIIACKLVKALLTLLITSFTARYLGAANYGLINYAAGVVAFAAPLMKLGLNSTIVHEIINRKSQEGKVIGTVTVINFFSAILCIAGIFAFTMIANKGETDTIIVTCLYSVLLIFQALEMIQYWFQAKLLSKFSSITMLVSYIIVSIVQMVFLVLKVNVYWFALSNSIDFFIIALVLHIIYKKKGAQKIGFSFQLAKDLLKQSKYYIISNLMIVIFTQTDKIMIKMMLNNTETGYYSAAVTCAGMTSFIFVAIIDSMRPSIFESQKNDKEKFKTNLKLLYLIIIVFSLVQCVLITLCSPLIIKILYGNGYVESIDVLRLVVWYTTFSYLGSVRNIWIIAEGKQKYLGIINFIGAFANVLLNFLLIPRIGIMGAALASLLTQFFTNVVIGFIIKPLRENNRIMFESLKPSFIRNCLKNIKYIRKK